MEEAALLQQFRELRLRARDGELTEYDYDNFISTHLDASKRRADFAGDDVYRLVTTRKLRDAQNLETLKGHVLNGAPAICIPAVHSSPIAERAVDDDLGLARSLVLCIHARVMLTKNISVRHGLCNGTMGTVYDIMCNEKGDAVAVLLRVKKRTLTENGYSGAPFLETLPPGDTVIPADEVVIAVDRWQEKFTEAKETHTRDQFPLMLAWCVTIHNVPLHILLLPSITFINDF